jgi:hypothetical protein
LRDYFANLNTKLILPKLNSHVTESYISSYDASLISKGKSYLEENELSNSTIEQGDLKNYLNRLLSCDRLIFCPLVRSFFRFDIGSNQELQQPDNRSSVLTAYEMDNYWHQV